MLFVIFLPKSLMAKFFFWGIVKILQTSYFEYLKNAWSCHSIIIVSVRDFEAQSDATN